MVFQTSWDMLLQFEDKTQLKWIWIYFSWGKRMIPWRHTLFVSYERCDMVSYIFGPRSFEGWEQLCSNRCWISKANIRDRHQRITAFRWGTIWLYLTALGYIILKFVCLPSLKFKVRLLFSSLTFFKQSILYDLDYFAKTVRKSGFCIVFLVMFYD